MMLMVNKDGSSTVIARRYCLGASRNTCPGDLSRVFHQYLKMEKGKVSFSFFYGTTTSFLMIPSARILLLLEEKGRVRRGCDRGS